MAFIDAHRDRFGVEPICRALTEHGIKITPSTFYANKSRPPSARSIRDQVLKVEILRVYESNMFVYGPTRSGTSSTAKAPGLPAAPWNA